MLQFICNSWTSKVYEILNYLSSNIVMIYSEKDYEQLKEI